MTPREADKPTMPRPGPRMRTFADAMHERVWPAILGRTTERRILLSLFAAFIVWIDYLTGPTIRFPAYYALPILLFGWYDGFVWGSVMGIAIVLARFTMERWIWAFVPWALGDSLMNAASSVLMLLLLTWFTARAGELTREVRLLWGLLPICMYCHRIRNEKNHWERLEEYVAERTQAQFTHGICPDCFRQKK